MSFIAFLDYKHILKQYIHGPINFNMFYCNYNLFSSFGSIHEHLEPLPLSLLPPLQLVQSGYWNCASQWNPGVLIKCLYPQPSGEGVFCSVCLDVHHIATSLMRGLLCMLQQGMLN